MKRRRFSEFQPVRAIKMTGRRVIEGAGVKYLRPCIQSRGSCATKLVFILPEDAKKLRTTPGPHLQYCKGKEPGMLVPVDNARQATDLAKKYCACIRKGGSQSGCEANIPAALKAATPFQGYPGRRRKSETTEKVLKRIPRLGCGKKGCR
jgi:hypothetical protein